MDQKKKLIIQVLSKLKPYRNLAEGILALVESSYCTNETIDGLIELIKESITSVKKEKEKTAIQKWLEKIQQIKAMEEEERLSEWDIDKLLSDI